MLAGNRPSIVLLTTALLGMAALGSPAAHAATMVVVNGDGAGIGFNDPTAAAPIGGNNGTTKGEQRLIAFQRAADIWGARLQSNVPILIQAQWEPLACDSTGGTLGSAGATSVYRDFVGAPLASTWYPIALASALFGSDLGLQTPDITARFNRNWGTPGCGDSSGWYLGLDGAGPANQIDFVTVLLHELGHGLGFQTYVNLGTGAKLSSFDDAFMRNLENHGASPPDYPSMSNAQRVAASIATGNLHWTGANVREVSSILSAGKVSDHVRMFAPNPQQPGSSVSHWDTALTPNQLLEPSYTQVIHAPDLEMALMRDIGWRTLATDSHDFDGDGKSDIAWRSTSGVAAAWLMNGNAVMGTGSLGGAGIDWQIVGQRDFDGDGKVDVLWRHSSGANDIWFLHGATVDSTAILTGIGTDWAVAGTGDFNGDGRGDILWRNNSGLLSVWLMNGVTITASQQLGGAPTVWQVAGIGDFNGDGKSDILFRHSSGANAIWYMNGTSVASTANPPGADTSWAVVGTGDFNGDGKSDILWRQSSGILSVWLMNGSSLVSSAALAGALPVWQVTKTGDFNGDGKSDILFRHSSGTNAIWYMNGTAVSSAGYPPGAGTEWTIQSLNAD